MSYQHPERLLPKAPQLTNMETCGLILLGDAQLLLDCNDFISCGGHNEDQKSMDRNAEEIPIVGEGDRKKILVGQLKTSKEDKLAAKIREQMR